MRLQWGWLAETGEMMRHQLVTENKRNREYLLEFVLLAVALSLAINLASALVTDIVGPVISGLAGLVTLLGCIALIAHLRLGRRTVHVAIKAAVAIDNDRKALATGNYEFGTEVQSLMKAIFAENDAFRRQWDKEPLGFTGMSAEDWRNRHTRGSFRLIRELAEYVALDKLSSHIHQYFTERGLHGDHLAKFTRESVPDVLLRNRVLEMVSKDMSDRPAFSWDPDPGGSEVVMQSGPGGFYSRFELILPKGSHVRRTSEGDVVIENSAVKLQLGVCFDGYLEVASPEFCRFIIRKPFEDVSLYGVDLTLTAKLKWRFMLLGRKRAYHEWLESLLDALHRELDLKAFQERVLWEQTELLLSALTDHMEKPVPKHSENFWGPPSMRQAGASANSEDAPALTPPSQQDNSQ